MPVSSGAASPAEAAVASSEAKAIFAKAIAHYQDLAKTWKRWQDDTNGIEGEGPKLLAACGKLLARLKITLTQLDFIPSAGQNPPQRYLLLAREVLEIGIQWSVATADMAAFERQITQLKVYYFDCKDLLPDSPYRNQYLGLNLLRLLSENRIAEFHTELELLEPENIFDDIYIKHPVALEQYLMEGSYNKVFLARSNVPAEAYLFFVEKILVTIREEIAACFESAYLCIPKQDALKMLFFVNVADLETFASKRGWGLEDQMDNGPIYLFAEANGDESQKQRHKWTRSLSVDGQKKDFESQDLSIARTLHYARELEKIV
jgi:26S proteasome regulatory subunit N12